MGGKRRLRGGFRPWLPDHRRHDGSVFRRYLQAAEETVGPATSERLRLEMERYAKAGVAFERTAATWAEIVRKRQVGRGQRPTSQAEERAARRMGLADQTLKDAAVRLDELGAQRRPLDLARQIQRAQQQERTA